MKKRFILLFGIALVFAFSSCQRGWQSFKKSTQSSKRHYEVIQFSGGEIVDKYEFYGVLTDSESSDGYYWFVGDTMYEVSGDVKIKSWN